MQPQEKTAQLKRLLYTIYYSDNIEAIEQAENQLTKNADKYLAELVQMREAIEKWENVFRQREVIDESGAWGIAADALEEMLQEDE